MTELTRLLIVWSLALLPSCSIGERTGESTPATDGGSAADLPGPLKPEEALARFQIEPGYRIELAAAEPLVVDPVAIAFDEWGRMYVVENRGYPDPPEGTEPAPPQGVIALLEDTDGDGLYDRRTEFAEALTYPNGILVWDGGVLVSCAPDLIYFKDTTGDGRADLRRVVLTGFAADKTAQIRFSHPTLGIDNWIYLTSGLNGGRVTAPDFLNRPAVVFERSDSRFNPFSLEFELTGGQGQFGLTFDDFGRRFICSNRHPVLHVVLESRHLRRNVHWAHTESVEEVSTVGAEAVVWPISVDRTTASFHPDLIGTPHAGTFTAASGVHIHRGDALPASDMDSVFICESAQNLVQRQMLTPSGVTFTARPARRGVEFLASDDIWFSPVFAANGPDGALYIVDMYRLNIDHPEYLPEAGRGQFDFEAGKSHGRIYRIVAGDWRRKDSPPLPGGADAQSLCRSLEHTNSWVRETAQRLLIERRASSVEPCLKDLLRHGKTAPSRVHALWTLEGLEGLDDESIRRALMDASPGVRENAVRLAEGRLQRSPDILSPVLERAADVDDRVRFQVALVLGESRDGRVVESLAEIARRDGAQRWTRAAVLSSIAGREAAFLKSFAAGSPPSPARAAVMADLGRIFGSGQPIDRCLELFLEITREEGDFDWQPDALTGLAEGLQLRTLGPEDSSPLGWLVSEQRPGAHAARRKLERVFEQSSRLALDEGQPEAFRLAAIGLLAHGEFHIVGQVLERLLEPQRSLALQTAAARALGSLREPVAGRTLVEAGRWRGYSPQLRETVLSVLLSHRRHLSNLVSALENGSIAPAALNPQRRRQLLRHADASIRDRAARLFYDLEAGGRMQTYEQVRDRVLTLKGDGARGKDSFERHCVACHRSGGGETGLGPDLSGIRNQPPEAILLHTLVPDYQITPGYEAFLAETADGRTLFGLLESETEVAVTLIDSSNQRHVLSRAGLLSLTASSHSLMPGELERLMSDRELADLIAFLRGQ